jgi:DNA invertase Pin-like site-specific DNA recombinase
METKQPDPKHACDWLRVSTVGQAYAGGIEIARKTTIEIAKRFGLNMRWSIDLPGISGARVMLTPQIQDLIRLITVDGCRHIVLKETSRLMRTDKYGDYKILDTFKDNGVTLYTPDKAWDFSSPDDRMMFAIEMGISSRERELIRRRTMLGREEQRQNGLCACGSNTLPLGIGYDRKRKHYFPTEEAEKVKLLFQLFTSGVTNFRQLALKTGISYKPIPKILANTVYIGIRTYEYRAGEGVYNDDDQKLIYQKMVKRDTPLVVNMAGFTAPPYLYPSIITESVFQHAQQLLAIKREQDWRGPVAFSEENDPFLFRGFLKCECGGKIICLPHTTGNYYCCVNAHASRRINQDGSTDWYIPPKQCRSYRMRAEKLDPVLGLLVEEKLGDAAFIGELLDQRRKEQDTASVRHRADTIRRQIEVTHAKKQRLNWVYVNQAAMSEDDWKQAKEHLDHQLDEQNKALQECAPTVPEVSEETLIGLLSLLNEWRFMQRVDQRAILRAVCPLFKVRLDGNGKKGGGAKTMVLPLGFFLNLGGDPVQVSSGTTEPPAIWLPQNSKRDTISQNGLLVRHHP